MSAVQKECLNQHTPNRAIYQFGGETEEFLHEEGERLFYYSHLYVENKSTVSGCHLSLQGANKRNLNTSEALGDL